MTIVKYDQHFMTDKEIIKKVVKSADLSKEDVVLEIGPGKGALTKHIAKKAKQAICIEIDSENEKELRKSIGKCENCQIIIGNALNYIETLSFNKIVSNLPYCLSEPLFRKMTKINLDLAVFTIGKHFYDIICDDTKKLHYLVNSFFDVKFVCDVSKSAFEPEPDVDSCVILLKIKKEKTLFDEIMCGFFLQNDKLLKNALMNVFWNKLSMTKQESKNSVSQIGLNEKDLNMNMDLVSNEEFLKVVKKVREIIKK